MTRKRGRDKADLRIYIGVTDHRWYRFVSRNHFPEVNFWRPSGRAFRALRPGDLFLFKLHRDRRISGGGFFVSFFKERVSIAWETFKQANGASDLWELLQMIRRYRKEQTPIPNPEIGCIVLTELFYFEEDEKIPLPDSWSPTLQSGKTYSITTAEGWKLYSDVITRLEEKNSEVLQIIKEPEKSYEVVRRRLRPPGFRLLVADAYHRRCAATGEKVYPVLEAAHIKPVQFSGPSEVRNGILLRADFHKLFDAGYMTLDEGGASGYRLVVSSRVKEEFDNGDAYLNFHGKSLVIVPDRRDERPAREYIQWHQENVYGRKIS